MAFWKEFGVMCCIDSDVLGLQGVKEEHVIPVSQQSQLRDNYLAKNEAPYDKLRISKAEEIVNL